MRLPRAISISRSAPPTTRVYATRAALSERGVYAKTHSGTWSLFSKIFVATGEFDQALSTLARNAKDAREKGDYEALPPSAAEAELYVEGAARFLTAVEELFDA